MEKGRVMWNTTVVSSAASAQSSMVKSLTELEAFTVL